jgi:hypothetical protein
MPNPNFTPDIRKLRKKMTGDPCVGIKDLSKRIAAETGVTQLDVYAVLKRWSDHTSQAIVDGTKVRMPGLGVFSPALGRKRAKVYFRPASDFKERLEAVAPETPVTPESEVLVIRRYS